MWIDLAGFLVLDLVTGSLCDLEYITWHIRVSVAAFLKCK